MRYQLLAVVFLLLAGLSYAPDPSGFVQIMAEQSDRIVRGKVMNLSYGPGTNQYGDELIYTDVYIRTAEALKGDRSDLILSVEGGTFNGITLTVTDMPQFAIGEEVLVFARKDLQTYRLFAGGMSKYTIAAGGKILENGENYGSFKAGILRILSNQGRKR